jgi:hypothetical protein
MSKAGKIALGCGLVAFLGIAAVVVMLVGGVWWAKNKVEETVKSVTTGGQEIEEYTRKANTVPFQEPADGVVAEEQLRRYIDVRKAIHGVYVNYQAQLEAKKVEDVSASDFTKALGAINDLRLAQAKGLAEVGMSEAEYRFVKTAVYQTLFATATQGRTGKQMSEVLQESARKANEAARAGLDQAGKVKIEGVGQASPEDIRKAQAEMAQMMEKAAKSAKNLEVPQANIDLFRKYKAELDKYAMNGLDLIGL